jgi:hypothetical protein
MSKYDIVLVESISQWNDIYNTLYKISIVNDIPAIHLIGLDCEYICLDNHKESFNNLLKNKFHNNNSKIIVCKLQLATNGLSIVIDLCKFNTSLPESLINILLSESWVKCGIGISNDILYLSDNYNLGHCNGLFELKTIVSVAGCSTPNLSFVYSTLFNTESNKEKDCCTDWSKEMTIEQLKYAANDAYISYSIGERLFKGLTGNLSGIFSKNNIKLNTDKIIESKSLIISSNTNLKSDVNYINLLQEYCQKNKLALPVYNELNSGNNTVLFLIDCIFSNNKTTGKGNNKKDAKQMAAKKMLETINN